MRVFGNRPFRMSNVTALKSLSRLMLNRPEQAAEKAAVNG